MSIKRALLLAVLSVSCATAFADGWNRGGPGGYGGNGGYGGHGGYNHHGGGYDDHGGRNRWGWVAPAVIGGVIGYALTRPAPVYAAPAPVLVQPSYSSQTYTPQVLAAPVQSYEAVPPLGYRWIDIIDANCNCYRRVLVPV